MQNCACSIGQPQGKRPAAIKSTLNEARLPFNFHERMGVQRDVETMLHEAGHAFSRPCTQPEDLFAYRSAPIDLRSGFDEVWNCSAMNTSKNFIPRGSLGRANIWKPSSRFFHGLRRSMLSSTGSIAPDISRAERTAAWLELMDRFGGEVRIGAVMSSPRQLGASAVTHLSAPIYYIEYAIAQLGACNMSPTPGRTNQKRCRIISGRCHWRSKPLPALFAAADCRFDFSV